MLNVTRKKIDRTPATYVWPEDSDVVAEVTPWTQDDADKVADRVDLQLSNRGEVRLSQMRAITLRSLRHCLKSLAGVEIDGEPVGAITQTSLEKLWACGPTARQALDDILKFATELGEVRTRERDEQLGNS